MLGSPFVSASPEAAGAALERRFRLAIESGEPVVFEEFFARFEGWFEVHAWPGSRGAERVLLRRQRAEKVRIRPVRRPRRGQAGPCPADVRRRRVATRLHGAVTRAELFERLSRAVITYMADWCTVVVPSGEELIRVAAAHRDPILDGLAKRLVGGYPHPFSGPSPASSSTGVASHCN